MKTIILSCLFTLTTTLSVAQKEYDELIQGNWILTEIKESPLYIANNNVATTTVQNDSVLFLNISENSITLINKRYYYQYDTVKFEFEIKFDSTRTSLLLYSPNPKKRKKQILRNHFELIKLNNSVLTLDLFQLLDHNPFFHYSHSRYYFTKVSPIDSVDERAFEYKWYICDNILPLHKRDTITLTRDSCVQIVANCKYQSSLEFKTSREGFNCYDFDITKLTCLSVMSGDYFSPCPSWDLDLAKNVVTLTTQKGNKINYDYQFFDNNLILVKNKTAGNTK